MIQIKPLLTKLLMASSVVAATLIPSPTAHADYWTDDCVRQPTSLSAANAATIRGIGCREVAVSAKLQGQDGSLHEYQFRDGQTIRVFITNPENLQLGRPYPILFSIRQGEWLPGQWLDADLPHVCGSYSCHWTTIRDAQGRVVVATRASI